jgi:hypothetical protein
MGAGKIIDDASVYRNVKPCTEIIRIELRKPAGQFCGVFGELFELFTLLDSPQKVTADTVFVFLAEDSL